MWDNSWPTLLHCTTLTLSSRMFFSFSSSPSFFSRWSKYSCSLSHSSYGTVCDYTQTIFLSSQIQAPHLLDYPVMWRLCIEDSLHLCSSHFGPFQWPLLALNIWRKNCNITAQLFQFWGPYPTFHTASNRKPGENFGGRLKHDSWFLSLASMIFICVENSPQVCVVALPPCNGGQKCTATNWLSTTCADQL